MLAIKNNIMAQNAARHLGSSYDGLAKSVERLSSGLRINSARDDAAGLAVRELIRADIAVQDQGSRNAQDGISMFQTMEGAMAAMNENLIRMEELAEQAATGSYSSDQRAIMNAEFEEMANEIERIANATTFNEINMLNDPTNDTVSIHVGTDETIDIEKVDMTKEGLGIETGTGGWQHVSDTGAADASDTWVTVSNDGADADNLTIQFDGEEEIAVELDATHDGTGEYSLNEIAAMINQASQDLGFDTEGNNLAYDAAEVVQDDSTGEYHLQLSSRGSDSSSMTMSLGATVTAAGGLTGNGDVSGDFDAGSEQAGLNILTADAAQDALDTVLDAINEKDTARAAFGYKMNRLESTISILNIQKENLASAESRISDVDVATEMAQMTRTQVLSQAGVAMLSQANSMPQMALSLLR